MWFKKIIFFTAALCIASACKPGKKNQTNKSIPEVKPAIIETCTIKNKNAPHTPMLAEANDMLLGEVENDTAVTIVEAREGTWVVSKTGYIKSSEVDGSYKVTDPKTKKEQRKVMAVKAYKPTAWREGPSEKVVFGQLENEAVVTLLEERGGWLKVALSGRVDRKNCLKK